MSKGRVLVAMSGGVDSSVAASLLKEQGYEVIGVTMQVWDYSANHCSIEEGNGTCCSSIDVDDARSVADRLGIPFYVINCEAKFKATVIDDFVEGYMRGETPIPCVNCNTFLKFDHLIQKMKELDCDYLATGHYARIEKVESDISAGTPSADTSSVATSVATYKLVTSSDSWKDQTYFLFTLNPEIVPKLLFPVGTWQKPELRAYAEEKGLSVARKKDSTGICFIGKKGYAGFIESQVDKSRLKSGLIKRFPTGEIIGNHTGIHHFTIGQRKGVGVAVGTPVHVVKIDVDSATVWMGDEKYLMSTLVKVKNANWIGEIQDQEIIKAKIRYAHTGAPAKVHLSLDKTSFVLEFFEPQRSITKGQAAVLYRDGQLLGGGWIEESVDNPTKSTAVTDRASTAVTGSMVSEASL